MYSVGGGSRSDLNLLLYLPICIRVRCPMHLFMRFGFTRGLGKARLQNLRTRRASRAPCMPRSHTQRWGRGSTEEGEVIRTWNLLRQVRGLRRRGGRRQPVSAHAPGRMVWLRRVISLRCPTY